MKKIALLLTPLLLILELHSQDITFGSTLYQYSKPGAHIDISYKSQKVDINETADVNITLTTAIRRGTTSILITLDKDLSTLKNFENNLSYEITPSEQDFLINLQVSSKKKGLYYIRLLTKVDKGYGIKLRSFAVPVYIGKQEKTLTKSITTRMKALNLTENISISKAVESIEVIKEK